MYVRTEQNNAETTEHDVRWETDTDTQARTGRTGLGGMSGRRTGRAAAVAATSSAHYLQRTRRARADSPPHSTALLYAACTPGLHYTYLIQPETRTGASDE